MERDWSRYRPRCSSVRSFGVSRFMHMKIVALCLIGLLAGCSSASVMRVTDIPYVENGHTRQKGDLYLPVGDGPWPVVIMLHGGGWIRRDRSDMHRKAQHLARAGFAVYNIVKSVSACQRPRSPSP